MPPGPVCELRPVRRRHRAIPLRRPPRRPPPPGAGALGERLEHGERPRRMRDDHQRAAIGVAGRRVPHRSRPRRAEGGVRRPDEAVHAGRGAGDPAGGSAGGRGCGSGPRGVGGSAIGLAMHVAPMPDVNNEDDQPRILDPAITRQSPTRQRQNRWAGPRESAAGSSAR